MSPSLSNLIPAHSLSDSRPPAFLSHKTYSSLHSCSPLSHGPLTSERDLPPQIGFPSLPPPSRGLGVTWTPPSPCSLCGSQVTLESCQSHLPRIPQVHPLPTWPSPCPHYRGPSSTMYNPLPHSTTWYRLSRIPFSHLARLPVHLRKVVNKVLYAQPSPPPSESTRSLSSFPQTPLISSSEFNSSVSFLGDPPRSGQVSC